MKIKKLSSRWLCAIALASPLHAFANQPPTAVDVYYFNKEDQIRLITPQSNDSDPDSDPLTIIAVETPLNGTASIQGNAILYTPKPDICTHAAPDGTAEPSPDIGVDQFSYQISDGHGGTSKANIRVGMLCANDAPVAKNWLNYANKENENRIFDPLAYATDADGNSMSLIDVSLTGHGEIVIEGNRLSYTHEKDFCTNVVPKDYTYITYRVKDQHGAVSEMATIKVDVVCQRPKAQNVTYGSKEDEERILELVEGFASDPNEYGHSNLRIHSVTTPTIGEMTYTDKVVEYTPKEDYCSEPGNANTYDYMFYSIVDPQGNVSDTYKITVMLACQADTPIANADVLNFSQYGSTAVVNNGDLLNNDVVDSYLGNGVKRIYSVTQPAHGTLLLSGDVLQYTAHPSYCNSNDQRDFFTYTLQDGNGLISQSAKVDVNVSCAVRPTANDDSYSMVMNASIDLSVTANDSINGGNGTLEIIDVFPAQHGTYAISEDKTKIEYTPITDYCGKDELTYRVKNSDGIESSVADVKILINCGKYKNGGLQYFDGLYDVTLKTVPAGNNPEANESFSDLSTLTVSNKIPTPNTKAYITVSTDLDVDKTVRPCTAKVESGHQRNCDLTYVVSNGGKLLDAVPSQGGTLKLLRNVFTVGDKYKVAIYIGSDDADVADSELSYLIIDYKAPVQVISDTQPEHPRLVVAYSYNIPGCFGPDSECLVAKLGHIELQTGNVAAFDFKVYDPLDNKAYDDKLQHWHCAGVYDNTGTCQTSTSGNTDSLVAFSAYWNRFNATVKSNSDGSSLLHPYFANTIASLAADREGTDESKNSINGQLIAKYGLVNLTAFDNNKAASGVPIYTSNQQGHLNIPRPYRLETGTREWTSSSDGTITVNLGYGTLKFNPGDLETGEFYLDKTSSSETAPSDSFDCSRNICTVTNLQGFAYLSHRKILDFQVADTTRFNGCYSGNAVEGDLRSTKPGDKADYERLIRLKHNFNASYRICPNLYQAGSELNLAGDLTSYEHVIGSIEDCKDRVGTPGEASNFNYCYEHLGLPGSDGVTLTDPVSSSEIHAPDGRSFEFDYNFLPFQGAHIYDTDYVKGRQVAPHYEKFENEKTKANGPYAVDAEDAYGGHKNAILVATDTEGKVKGMVFVEQSYDSRFVITGIGYKKAK